MDHPHPVAPDDADLAWSDSHSMDSDDIQSASLPSPWLGSLPVGSTSVSFSSSSTMSFAHTGQLSPISNGVDLPPGAARSSASFASPSQSPPVTAESYSASSSVPPQGWLLGYHPTEHTSGLAHGPESYGTHRQGDAWEAGPDELLEVTKLEPLDDDDFCMDDLEEAPSPPIPTPSSHPQGSSDQPKPKRPRGRPRKHPLLPNITTNKITKGRSKTGCLTCRKRKKKCDEAKPRCMNCEKNAVVCEGYPEKQIWKSGKERAEEERLRFRNFPPITMPPLIHGLETVEDRVFWKHYNEHLSAVLTVEGEHKNAFKDMMGPIAARQPGLMHSILSLASKHIDFETPYGINVLKNNPYTNMEALRRRSLHHHDQARDKFFRGMESANAGPNTDDTALVAARHGQLLCFLLEALVEGSSQRELKLHLGAYRNLASSSPPPEDDDVFSFIAEVFQYHILADELIHSAVNRDALLSAKRLPQIPAAYSPRLLGVADGLFDYLSRITALRNRIRDNVMAQIDPPVSYYDLDPAVDIDVGIREWAPHWPPGDSRDQATLLFKQATWIYLKQTIDLPSSSPPSPLASSAASLPCLHHSPSHARPAPAVVNTPPQSASTSCASSPRLSGSSYGSNPKTSRANLPSGPSPRAHGGHLGTGETAAAGGSRPDSPPPSRQPPNRHPDVVIAVEESLALLESFKPSDPCQTLLLLPCFLVGTACFSPAQQRRVRAAIRVVRGYTGLRNADRAAEVLDEVWRLMEAGDWVAAWDWPGVAERLGADFMPA